MPRQISHVIFDFDGTCTQIPFIYEGYLNTYHSLVSEKIAYVSEKEWLDSLDFIRTNSPKVGWTLGGPQPAAPAAADPYILAYEAAKLIFSRRKIAPDKNASEIHKLANEKNEAPWRSDALETFQTLLKKNVAIRFISNSSTESIHKRLDELFANHGGRPTEITVHSGAAKFRICELHSKFEQQNFLNDAKLFENVPETFDFVLTQTKDIGRPCYLRRGAYFEALHAALEKDISGFISKSLVCGDIWEMDLAMPYALGANVHLLKRAMPFDTYEYECNAVNSYGDRGKISNKLSDLLSWF